MSPILTAYQDGLLMAAPPTLDLIGVSGPTTRILDRLDEIAVDTRNAAQEISERMRGAEDQLQSR